jgi:hypothetical protein
MSSSNDDKNKKSLGVYAANEDPAIVALAKKLNILEEEAGRFAGRLGPTSEFCDCAIATHESLQEKAAEDYSIGQVLSLPDEQFEKVMEEMKASMTIRDNPGDNNEEIEVAVLRHLKEKQVTGTTTGDNITQLEPGTVVKLIALVKKVDVSLRQQYSATSESKR